MRHIPKRWIFFFLAVVGLIVAIIATSPSPQTPIAVQSEAPEPTRYATYEGMLDLGGNAIYLENQPSGQSIVLVGFSVLSQPGFVVVYDDAGGVPGTVVGVSGLLESGGEHLVVSLGEPLADGQVYYAILYHDDGDGRFNEQKDAQAVDSQQSVVLMSFLASVEADPETGPVVP